MKKENANGEIKLTFPSGEIFKTSSMQGEQRLSDTDFFRKTAWNNHILRGLSANLSPDEMLQYLQDYEW